MYDLLQVVIFMPIYLSMYSRPCKTFLEKVGYKWKSSRASPLQSYDMERCVSSQHTGSLCLSW